MFDLRSTTWAARIRVHDDRPAVMLTFVSHETKDRDSAATHPLVLDLVGHRVSCPTLDGSSTIGMLQAMVRQVRGATWMKEELPHWFAKGLLVPRVGR